MKKIKGGIFMGYRILILKILFFMYIMILVLSSSITNAAFTETSLNGDYWISHYEYNTEPYHRTELGTMIFDGNGNYSFNGTESRQGGGADMPITDTGTYSVTSDGQISFDGDNIGRLSDNGQVIIGTNVSSISSWHILIFVKKTVTESTGSDDNDGGGEGGCFISVVNSSE